MDQIAGESTQVGQVGHFGLGVAIQNYFRGRFSKGAGDVERLLLELWEAREIVRQAFPRSWR